MKTNNRIHLNGYPKKQGVILAQYDGTWGKSHQVHWDSGKITRNPEATLCQCKNGECEG